MQYSVSGSDGNTYGPVDLMTLQRWVQEGRIQPSSQITDHLSQVTVAASQMPELHLNPVAPPAYSQYPRASYPGQPMQPVAQKSALTGVLVRIGIAILLCAITQTGGIIFSSVAVYHAAVAISNKDRNGPLALGLSIASLICIGLYTIYKVRTGINSY